MWKILTAQAPNDVHISFYMSQRSAIKASVPEIPRQRSNLSLFDKSFSVIGPKLWNLIPGECSLILDSLEKFKVQLDAFLLDYPDLPPVSGYFCPNSNSMIDWANSRNFR